MSNALAYTRMARYGRIAAVVVAGCAVALPAFAIEGDALQPGATADSLQRPPQAMAAQARALPSASPDVTDLAFRDFYKLPVGRYGLEPTEKLLSLDGKQVRILGYMVRRERPVPGTFILSPLAVNMAEEADGEADDLPPAIVFVRLPEDSAQVEVNNQPGLFLLTGVLSLGAREEPDGRISFVRLQLAWPLAERAAAAASENVTSKAP